MLSRHECTVRLPELTLRAVGLSAVGSCLPNSHVLKLQLMVSSLRNKGAW